LHLLGAMLAADPFVTVPANTTAPTIRRILLVDDERSILRSLARALRALRPEWAVHVAESGIEALCHLERSTCDAVVTDLEMPGLDGLELLLRVQTEHPHVVRLVHSSRIDSEDSESLRRLAQGAVAKPAHPSHLISLIESALSAEAEAA
jgi:DNA-binding NtrC family response regulator